MRAVRRQGGYVLLMVLAALAVMAYVAQRFAQRNDELRRNALDFTQYAQGRAAAASALAATLYWNDTRPMMPAGRGDAAAQLRQDGQRYETSDGALVSVQDGRGLVSLNAVDRRMLTALLTQDGVPLTRAHAMVDVLNDYIDTDQLKRLNGAEAPEYRALGLPPPRNDWLLSVRELETMPLWRDDPARLARMSRWFSTELSNLYNPITMPEPLLRALWPTAPPAQIDLVLNLRRSDLLRTGRNAQALTGLPFESEEYLLAPGFESRITVWAPGLPRALEYNARLTPAAELGPWVITQQHTATRLDIRNEASPALAFPLPLPVDAGVQAASSPSR